MDNVVIVFGITNMVLSVIGCLFILYCFARILFRMNFSRPIVILLIIFPLVALITMAFAKWPIEENLRDWKSRFQEAQS